MNTDNTCPQCNAKLPPDAPAGLCPRCLIRSAAGLAEPPPDVDFPDIGDAADVARRLPQFEIIELLGKGGMGVVYKARQPALDRLVALKILPPADALSPDFVERFRREARALAKLNHPNIVAIHDSGEQGGLYFFVMEYVDGVNLRQLFEGGKLPPAEALAIVPRVCDALEYAHEEGVVHRDIKPENLLIDKKGRVKIADFGLAKLLRREPLDLTLTLSGVALGTMRYMAPEQMEKPGTVDHRADIYSLGVVIYEMLTGEVPVGRFELPSQKAQVDVRLDEIVLHALEREPARRYQHASEVKTDVEKVTGQPQAAEAPASSLPPPDSETGMPAPPPRLSRLAMWGVIWAAFFLCALTAGMREDLSVEGPIWFRVVMACFLVAVICAPVGTMILGALSIRAIKRSGGQLYGLPLAAVALLFFPLCAIVVGVVKLFERTVESHFFPSLQAHSPLLLWSIPSACILFAFASWRAIAGRQHPGFFRASIEGLTDCFNRSGRWMQKGIRGVLNVTAIVGLVAVFDFQFKGHVVTKNGKISKSERTLQIGAPSAWLEVRMHNTSSSETSSSVPAPNETTSTTTESYDSGNDLTIHPFSSTTCIGLAGMAAFLLSGHFRRSRPGFDEIADRRKRRWWLIAALVAGVIYVGAIVAILVVVPG